MIPTLLFVGLLAGRWYVVGIAAVGWPLLLLLDGTLDTGAPTILAAAAFGAANTAVGVAIHKALFGVTRTAIAAARR